MSRGTETAAPHYRELDRYATADLVAALIDDQQAAFAAVQAAAPALTHAVDLAVPRLVRGGRLIYIGAGTSGRLALLDSVELWPTFSWPAQRAVPLLAGGAAALLRAVEGAEDDTAQGAADITAQTPGADDVVIGLAASGRTPYVIAAIEAARAAGSLTLGIVNNPETPLCAAAEIAIVLDSGPEVIAGSTRLKAGTAQKIALNTLSTALMVRLGKVYGNLMVDLQATNAKLRQRAEDLVLQLTGAAEATVREALRSCAYRVKPAVVMLRCGVSAQAARERLGRCDDDLRRALDREQPTD